MKRNRWLKVLGKALAASCGFFALGAMLGAQGCPLSEVLPGGGTQTPSPDPLPPMEQPSGSNPGSGNTPPKLNFIWPSTNLTIQTGAIVQIRVAGSDLEDDMRVNIALKYVDPATNLPVERVLVQGQQISRPSGEVSVAWNTTVFPQNVTYTIAGTISDEVNSVVEGTSPGKVTIAPRPGSPTLPPNPVLNIAPTVRIANPTGENVEIEQGTQFDIKWETGDFEDHVFVDVIVQSVTHPNAPPIVLVDNRREPTDPAVPVGRIADNFIWDTTNVAAETYTLTVTATEDRPVEVRNPDPEPAVIEFDIIFRRVGGEENEPPTLDIVRPIRDRGVTDGDIVGVQCLYTNFEKDQPLTFTLLLDKNDDPTDDDYTVPGDPGIIVIEERPLQPQEGFAPCYDSPDADNDGQYDCNGVPDFFSSECDEDGDGLVDTYGPGEIFGQDVNGTLPFCLDLDDDGFLDWVGAYTFLWKVDTGRVPPLTDANGQAQPYFLRVSVSDGEATVHSYASGHIVALRPAIVDTIVDLGEVGNKKAGARFQGFSDNDNLGTGFMAAGDQLSTGTLGVAADEFMIVSRYGQPRSRGNVGSAYYLLGQPLTPDFGRFAGTLVMSGTGAESVGFVVGANIPTPNPLVQRIPPGCLTNDPVMVIGALRYAPIAGLAFDPASNVLYGTALDTQQLVRINPATGLPTAIGPVGSLAFNNVQGLAFDSETNTLYGMQVTPVGGILLTIDTSTGLLSSTRTLTGGFRDIRGLAYDTSRNALFGSSTFSNQLVRIDIATGATTLVGQLGFTGIEGLDYDPATDRLLGSSTTNGQFYRINPTTGVASHVGSIGFLKLAGLAFNTLTGQVMGTDATSQSTGELVAINPATGAGAAVAPSVFRGLRSSVVANDLLYAVSNATQQLLGLNPETGAGVAVAPTGVLGFSNIEALAYNATGDVLYGTDGSRLIRIDRQTGAGTLVGSIGFTLVKSMVFDAAGILFAVSNQTSQLLRINTATGAGAPVGLTGFDDITGLADDGDAAGLVAIDVETSQALRVDKATGAAAVERPIDVNGISDLAFDGPGGPLLAVVDTNSLLLSLNLDCGGRWSDFDLAKFDPGYNQELTGVFSLGVTSVVQIPDFTDDGLPELAFGLPYMSGLGDAHDPDPCDCNMTPPGCSPGSPVCPPGSYVDLDPFTPSFPNSASDPDPCPPGEEAPLDVNYDNGASIDQGYVFLSTSTTQTGFPGYLEVAQDTGFLDLKWVGQLGAGGSDDEGVTIDVTTQISEGCRFRGGYFGYPSSAPPLDSENEFGRTLAVIPGFHDTVDDIADLIISAPGTLDDAGRIYVLIGNNWSTDRKANDGNGIFSWPGITSASCDCRMCALGRGYGGTYPDMVTIDGIAGGRRLGFAQAAGDLNADFRPDLVCGAPFSPSPNGAVTESGRVFVVYRPPGGLGNIVLGGDSATQGPSRLELYGTHDFDRFGHTQQECDDIDGNGLEDMLVASGEYDDGGNVDAGFVGVVSARAELQGTARLVLPIEAIGSAVLRGIKFIGAPGSKAGHSASSAGDFDKDGVGDLLIAAPNETRVVNGQLRRGVAYLIYGGSHLVNRTLRPIGDQVVTDRGAAVRSMIFVSPYEAGSIDEAPLEVVSGIGDVDGDGFSDLMIGAPHANFIDPIDNSQRQLNAGQAYLVYGNNRQP